MVAGKEIGVSNLKAHKLFTAQIKRNLTLRNNFFITFIFLSLLYVNIRNGSHISKFQHSGPVGAGPETILGENYSALAGRPNFKVPFKRLASNSILRL